jgi:hypothetical protein
LRERESKEKLKIENEIEREKDRSSYVVLWQFWFFGCFNIFFCLGFVGDELYC